MLATLQRGPSDHGTTVKTERSRLMTDCGAELPQSPQRTERSRLMTDCGAERPLDLIRSITLGRTVGNRDIYIYSYVHRDHNYSLLSITNRRTVKNRALYNYIVTFTETMIIAYYLLRSGGQSRIGHCIYSNVDRYHNYTVYYKRADSQESGIVYE